MNTEPIYNTIGDSYNTTRKADPYITERLYYLLSPTPDGKYLDIGCGTGNYLKALEDKGLHMIGVDPSEKMLTEARISSPNAEFVTGKAEELPINDNQYDGAVGTFTLHHWTDIQAGLNELYRVLKPSSKLIFLSFTPEQMDQYWLIHYFPDMIKKSGRTLPELKGMQTMLLNAGFKNIQTEKYFVDEKLIDHFLFSNKYRPEQYLDAKVRQGISSFRLFVTDIELNDGLVRLEQDIASGAILDIIKKYESDLGDYIFYIAEKP